MQNMQCKTQNGCELPRSSRVGGPPADTGHIVAAKLESPSAVILHRGGDTLELFKAERLEQPGSGVEGPVDRTDATLVVARFDPIDQLAVAELVGVAQAVINVAAVDLPVPENAVLRRQALGD